VTDIRVYAQRAEVFTQTGDAYSAQVMRDKPLGYWRLGERSGNTAYDFSGWGRDMATGASHGSPTMDVTAINPHAVTSCFTFDGSDDRCQLAYASWMESSSFTVEAWIKRAATGAYHQILDRDMDSTGTRVFQFRASSTNKLEFIVHTSEGIYTVTGSTTLGSGTVYHVAATFSGTSLKCYVNGLEDGQTTCIGTLNTHGSTDFIHIGASAGIYNLFNGQIQDAAFYGKALTAEQIASHYRARRVQYLLYDDFSRVASTNSLGAGLYGPAPTYENNFGGSASSWSSDGNLLVSSVENEGKISWDLGTTSYILESVLGSSSPQDAGMCFRWSGTGYYWMAYLGAGGTSNQGFYTYDQSNYTLQQSTTAVTWAAGDTMRVVNTPTGFELFRKASGQSYFTSLGARHNDSNYSGSTKVGFRANNGVVKWGQISAQTPGPAHMRELSGTRMRSAQTRSRI
jgi:hypothetical protein